MEENKFKSKYITAKEIKETLACSTGKAYEILHSLEPISIGGRGKRVLRSKFEQWEWKLNTTARAEARDRAQELRKELAAVSTETNLQRIRRESREAYRRAQAEKAKVL